MISAGHLLDPDRNDKRFETEASALKYAAQGSYDDDVWAVWEDESGEIIAIVYQQMAYYP